MAGLLDVIDDPQQMGLLSLGLRLMSTPGKFGQALGTAGMGAMNDVQNVRNAQDMKKQRDLQAKLIAMQIEDTSQQAKQREMQAAKLSQAQDWARKLMGMGNQPEATQSVPSMMTGSGTRTPDQNAQVQSSVSQQTIPRSFLSQLNEDQIVGLLASGAVPEKAYDAWKFSKVGEQMQPGYVRTPDGRLTYNPDPTKGITLGRDGTVMAMPGASSAQAELAGASAGATTAAQEAAKAPYNFIDTWKNGVPGKVSVASLVGQQDGSVGRDQVSRDVLDPTTQYSSPAVRAQVEKLAGGKPGFLQTGPSSQDKSAEAALGELNKSFIASSYTPTLQAGEAAKSVIANVQTARKGLAMSGSGWGTDAKVQGARVLAALGVPEADKVASGAQMFQQGASERLWVTLNAAKGPQTEGDAQRAQMTFAQLKNTPRANQFILDLAQAVAERDLKKSSWYRDALPIAQQAGDLNLVDRNWAQREPSVWSMPSMQKWAK